MESMFRSKKRILCELLRVRYGDTPRRYRRVRFGRSALHWLLLSMAMWFSPAAAAQDCWYTVRPGDNLWSISETYLLSMAYWRALGRINQLPDPDDIAPGTRLRIPIAWLKVRPLNVEVLAVTGTVRRGDGDGRQHTVHAGMRLEGGDTVSTEDNSSVTLRFADGSTLLLQQNASLVLDTLSAYGDTGMVDTRLRLQRGRVDNQVFSRPGDASYRVDTPVASAAVRGTRFRVGADEQGETRTEVLEGAAVLTGATRSVTLHTRQGSLARPGQAPLDPVPLLPPPDMSGIPSVVHRLPASLPLPPLADGVQAYRVQLAGDADFRGIVHDALLDAPPWTLPVLEEGEYYLRLRGIDVLGLEGADADMPLRVALQPTYPFLLKPAFLSIDDEHLELRWASEQPGERYRIQWARDRAFQEMLVDRVVERPDIILSRPAAGTYFLRTRVIRPDGSAAPLGPIQRVTVPAPPQTSTLPLPQVLLFLP